MSWIYGNHAVTAALKNPKRLIKKVVATKNYEILLKELKVDFELASGERINVLLGKNVVHQGIAAEVMPLSDIALHKIENGLVLMLDGISDPQNIGNIIRSAAAFNVKCVVLEKRYDIFNNATIAKAASGALEMVPIMQVVNLARTVEDFKQHSFWIVGLAGEAKDFLEKHDWDKETVLVLGSEGEGMRRLLKEKSDFLLAINTNTNFPVLNVTNAAAVGCFAYNLKWS